MSEHINGDKIKKFLQDEYDKAMIVVAQQEKYACELPEIIRKHVDTVLDAAETSKGVFTVLFTSLIYKALNPEQDVRKHQSGIEGGYSGRTFDTKYITPFLKERGFPSMAESGWLTRSLEQKVPYDMDYTGAITPKKLKKSFLSVFDALENQNIDVGKLISYCLQGMIINRDKKDISLATPQNLSVAAIIQLLSQHFLFHYFSHGAARLPVLALYAIYQSLFEDDFKRYSGKTLLGLESHTSADTRSGRLGDIDIIDDKGNPFEAVEVKFEIEISHEIVTIAREKIQPSTVSRYYILSTKSILDKDYSKIENDVKQIKNVHGCQLIINGVFPTLKYYLRLLDDTSLFIKNYVHLLMTDKTIKYEHKRKWNELISAL
uniref:DNA methyltransferase n=1 Tax=Prevotella sp. GTC17259 TaxID=3236795 RepID=A0AB33J911_9BACT